MKKHVSFVPLVTMTPSEPLSKALEALRAREGPGCHDRPAPNLTAAAAELQTSQGDGWTPSTLQETWRKCIVSAEEEEKEKKVTKKQGEGPGFGQFLSLEVFVGTIAQVFSLLSNSFYQNRMNFSGIGGPKHSKAFWENPQSRLYKRCLSGRVACTRPAMKQCSPQQVAALSLGNTSSSVVASASSRALICYCFAPKAKEYTKWYKYILEHQPVKPFVVNVKWRPDHNI